MTPGYGPLESGSVIYPEDKMSSGFPLLFRYNECGLGANNFAVLHCSPGYLSKKIIFSIDKLIALWYNRSKYK